MHPRSAPVFGRRSAPAATRAARPAADGLSPAAERLRSELAGASSPAADAFAAWKRRRRLGRAAAWLAGLVLMSPGVICFVAHVPSGVSALVEAAGLGANWWLRRLRRHQLAAIRAWEPGEG